MARVVYTPIQGARARLDTLTVPHLALSPTTTAEDDGWSIDEAPSSSGWHESSWMLRNGLDVIEGIEPDHLPVEWWLRWHISSGHE